MSKLLFTPEQRSQLLENPYTLSVTAKQIAFTKEFKERFWHCRSLGMSTYQIIKECGYNPEWLGPRRISMLRERIKREAASERGFRNSGSGSENKNRYHKSKKDYNLLDPTIEVQLLREKVEYLEQQMEFLKKITSIKTSIK